jgi:hypothetical protein
MWKKTTGVEAYKIPAKPVTDNLFHKYRNPFNPIKISFTLSGPVRSI